ncbi:glycodelin [Monodelphis domestica]|uniref:glycodelin n=1 Tax=Monodelphis domestica TaxID=13616 RepID=UPI0024E24A21|nr:glycodelin [Monodelphis domestica]
MKFFLLTVGLALIGTIQAIEHIYPQKDVVVEKVRGGEDIKEVDITPQGDLELVIARRTENCVEKKILVKKTEKPAVFEIDVPSEHDLHTLTMVKTDYDNFTLVCLNMDSLEKKACAYFGKAEEANPLQDHLSPWQNLWQLFEITTILKMKDII